MAFEKYTNTKGTFWMLNAYIGTDPETGKHIYVTRRGFKTKKEAESALRELRYDFDHHIIRVKSRTTFREVAERWMKLYHETVRDSTYQKAHEYLLNHILPAMGNKSIDGIRPLDCQDLVNHLSETFRDYRKVYNYAIRIFDYARTIGITSKENPFRRVVFPKQKGKEKETPFFEKEELRAIFDAMKEHHLWYTFFYLLAFTGMRRGEALALHWSDFDLQEGTLTISKTLSTGEGNKQVLHDTKTEAGMRTIDLDRSTIEVMKRWKAEQKVVSLDGIVFPNSKGDYISISKPYAYFQRIAKRLGIHGTIHSFRHTHASMLFEAGWSIKDVQARLGHRDVNTTMNIYTHVTKRRKAESMKEFEDFVGDIIKISSES